MNTAITLLEPPYFDYYWPQIERELDTIPHLWADRITKDDIYGAVQRKEMQVWAVGPSKTVTMVVFTQIINFGPAKALQVVFCFGGDLEEALPLLDATLERFAFVSGCSSIEVIGRKGWFRTLRPLGFHLDKVIMRRNVKHMELM
jgi:hypothetical protein